MQNSKEDKMAYDRIFQTSRLKFFEVADNVFAAIAPNKGFGWSNAGFINKGCGLVYDTFMDLAHARELRETYEKVSGRAYPSFVVNSHYNCDHTWGNKVFKNHSAIIMHPEALRERLGEDPKHYAHLIRRAKEPDATPGELIIGGDFNGFELDEVEWVDPDILITGDTTILLGDTKAEILSIAPAHSDSDLLLWLPAEKVLFVGDVIFSGVVAYTVEGMHKWLAALDNIIALAPNIIVPGHGKLCGVAFVREQKAYFEMVFSEFKKHYTEDIDIISLVKKVDVSDFLHWLQPERIFLNILTLFKAERGLPAAPDWDYNAEQLAIIKKFHEQKYGTQIKPWNPMETWAE
jgi:glyoxylase-like metal-dependent hydrolase (beta-lactamase superfamily II)